MTGRVVAALLAAALLIGVAVGFGWVAATGPVVRVPGSPAPSPSAALVPSASVPAAVASPSQSPAASPVTGSNPPSPGTSETPSSSPSPYTGPLTRQVPVLMYHLVGDPPPGAPYPGLYVSAASFDAQMHALHDAGWRTITAGQLGAAMAANRPVPTRTFVAMFDDGYEDNFTTALPILQRYGFVGTFSVVATGGSTMMTSPQLAALLAAGMEVGNHTLNHKNVASLGEAQLAQQIEGGAARIEARLSSQGVTYIPKTFVYPSGHVSNAAVTLLHLDGYTDAFTEVPGVAVIGTTMPLRIPRLRVSRFESLATFLATMPAELQP
jgi:peptidoglycan/xylan/chitin deacetylase (PgdA/CDA1 family)